MQQPLMFCCFAMIVSYILIIGNKSLIFPSDVIESHLLSHFTTADIFKISMCINKQWSIAAIKQLTERTRFLSLKQIKIAQRRAQSMNLTLYEKKFAMELKERNLMIQRYSVYPSIHPLRFTATNDYIMIESTDNHLTLCHSMETITVRAYVMDSIVNKTSVYSETQKRISVGKNLMIKIYPYNISIYRLIQQRYIKQYQFTFFMEDYERIQYFDIEMYAVCRVVVSSDVPFIDAGLSVALKENIQPISILDMYSLESDLNLMIDNDSSPVVFNTILRLCNLQ